MSAARLREAAALMRSRAEAATPGPWEFVDGSEFGREPFIARKSSGPRFRFPAHAETMGTRSYDPAEYLNEALFDAEHIASWHPLVALAAAHVLSVVADGIEGERRGDDPSHWRLHETAALAVADAYLGADSSPPT